MHLSLGSRKCSEATPGGRVWVLGMPISQTLKIETMISEVSDVLQLGILISETLRVGTSTPEMEVQEQVGPEMKRPGWTRKAQMPMLGIEMAWQRKGQGTGPVFYCPYLQRDKQDVLASCDVVRLTSKNPKSPLIEFLLHILLPTGPVESFEVDLIFRFALTKP